EPNERRKKHIAAVCLVRLARAWWLRHAEKQRHGEHHPPHRDRKQGQTRWQCRGSVGKSRTARQAEPPWLENPREVQREQHAAPDIANGIAGTRYPVDLIFRRNVWQKSVVKHG